MVDRLSPATEGGVTEEPSEVAANLVAGSVNSRQLALGYLFLAARQHLLVRTDKFILWAPSSLLT